MPAKKRRTHINDSLYRAIQEDTRHYTTTAKLLNISPARIRAIKRRVSDDPDLNNGKQPRNR